MKKLKRKMKAVVLTLALLLQLVVPTLEVQAAQTFYDNKTGNEDGYDYELWKDNGSTSMTIKGGGNFECWWENIGNALFRKGKKFDCTQTYQQIGNISIDFGVDYQPNGNSYLCVYGWTRDPLVEYYIVESWGSWRPPGATSKGQITVDGGTYDVYETTRVNQPSIDGNTTFQQYWSVRTSKRTSGTISVSQHFQAWERMGMKMGKLYEAALNVEGYQSSGWADVYKNDIKVGGNISSGGGNNGGNNGGSSSGDSNSAAPGTAQGTRVECESMTLSGQYAGKVSSPFSGVALYANNESVSYTQNFTSGTHDFTLSGASDGSNLAKVDLVIGGQNKGTFYFGDANHAEYTIKNVSHGTGNQKIELVVNEDDGSWDALCDALIISGSGVGGTTGGNNNGGNTGNNGGNTGGNTGNNGGNAGGTTSGNGTTIQCENMTISGQYAGKISSPFSGVALYGNNDAVKFTQNFTSGTSTFVLKGASNNNNMAKVDLKIGGQTKGTFYYGDSNTAEYTIENVSTGTGNQTVELVVTADDGNWDAYLDSLTITGGVGSSNGNNGGNTGNNGGNTGNNGGNTGNNGGNTGSSSNKIECENMTLTGQYAGKVSSPFSGVALYANNESVKFTHNFTSGTNNITLRGASNNDNMAKVDLKIGGQTKGTFYYGDANAAEYTIENVNTGTGNQTVELVVTTDDGSWDAYLDYVLIGGQASNNNSNNNNNNNNNGGYNGGKIVALTFDDGPTSTTSEVLDILEREGVVATFFLIGEQVNSNTMSIMQRQVNMGCELANHSYNHVDMSGMSASDIRNQIEWTSSAIKNTVGVTPKFFRPPYLATSNSMYQNIDLAFIEGINTQDYDSSVSANQRVNNVMSNVKDGSIILMHDFQGNSQTVQALPTIIQNLKSQGYTFVTVSQLFEYKGVNPNQEYKIWTTVQ